MASDNELLRRYTASRSEEAFAELVRRHLNLVYFTALRRTNGQTQLAEEVTQLVFITLARQAASLQRHAVLAGWLYVSTRHAAAKAMRSEKRRKMREQEAQALQEISSPPAPEADWSQIRPELDAVLDDLNARDRDAVLLRFFENRPFAEIGAALRISEDAARMRVDRTLDKLRALLARRGITSTTAALVLALEQSAGAAAPAALAVSINVAVAASVVTGAAGSAAAVGFLAFMSSTKIVTGFASAMAVIALTAALHEASRARESAAEAVSLAGEVRLLTGRNTDLQRELSELRSAPALPPPTLALNPDRLKPADTPSTEMRADDPLTNPEARRLHFQKEEVQLELNTRQFFAKLGFSSEQWERYKGLIIGGLQLQMDVEATARARGLSNKEQEALLIPGLTEARVNLRALLGDDANKSLIRWNQELALRNSAGELAAKLLYTDEPLTAQQAEQYVKVLAGIPGMLGRNAKGVLFLSETAMTQLEGVLSPAQFTLLQQQQSAHRTDQQMAALSKK